MPICPENYMDRQPLLTDEEKDAMQKCIAAPGEEIGEQMQKLLDALARFEVPFKDAMQLLPHSAKQLVTCRHALFSAMIQTGTAFWAWEDQKWAELIQAAPATMKPEGTKFTFLSLAYLFCDFLYVGPQIPYTALANVLFGKEVLDAEMEKIHAPLAAAGYHTDYWQRRHLYSFVFLVNRCPYVEALSAQTLATVKGLLPQLPVSGDAPKRSLLFQLQTSLSHLGILDDSHLLETSSHLSKHFLLGWKNDPTIDTRWSVWICAFYEQTPHRAENAFLGKCYSLMIAGRWLKRFHPEIFEPGQWTEALAHEYVTYTCSALLGELTKAKLRTHEPTQQIGPGGIMGRLSAMRTFFSHLQRRSYTVSGRAHPKLQLTWLPDEAFKTPDDIKAIYQPNPRDIAEDAWFKLIWAACTLTQDKLQALKRIPRYPLAYFRAVCLIWVTAARRSDEIRRLQVGCVRREWAPEMHNKQGVSIEPEAELAYLRIPVNKMRGDFYVPVPLYVADAIEVWESVRPLNQKAWLDRKTGKPTNYLFQYRDELMGRTFLNESVIPLLCKLAGVNQTDVVGRITSHRARATTATWLHKMGMAPADIGKLLGHTDPLRSLPWYLREDKHRLGRAYRKANPLERYVAAILDTDAHARQDPCVFYYLADGPDGRPRMCGNPHFSRCIHQLQCIECEAFIDHEQAEAIEKREGAIVISVPIPLPPQMVAELNEQDEAGNDDKPKLEALPPPTLPGPAFHFNKKVPIREPANAVEGLREKLIQVEAQIAKKQGKADRRSASYQALLKERTDLQTRLEAMEQENRDINMEIP